MQRKLRRPLHADGRLWYVISVNPTPWAVGELGFTVKRDGSKRVYMAPNRDLKLYQEAIREEMADFITFPLATELDVVFVFNRALDEIFRGKFKSHAHYADATNMQKATEDALQGVLFGNDNQNRVVTSIIREQSPEADPCVAIGIKTTTDKLVYELVPDLVSAEIVRVSQ